MEIKSHFKEFFKEPNFVRLIPEGILFRSLDNCDRNDLEFQFTVEVVKDGIWICDSNKSPGPDGFTLEFFKKN